MQPITSQIVEKPFRHIHHIVIGVDRKIVPLYRIDAAYRALLDDISRLTGGLTAWVGDGTWMLNAQQGDYSGPIERDAALNVIVTLTNEDRPIIWPIVQTTIAGVVLDHDLGCDHIHVMVWPAQSGIFCVNDTAESATPDLTPAISSTVTATIQNDSCHGFDQITAGRRKSGDH